ncbi:MAG: hypothetical protein OIF57_11985 [Marinobacterium sp.]|nr:hypothetical protein [Marinobacterium sp.]
MQFKPFNSIEIKNRAATEEQIQLRVMQGLLLSESDQSEVSINPAQNEVTVDNAAALAEEIGKAVKYDPSELLRNNSMTQSNSTRGIRKHRANRHKLARYGSRPER